MTEFPTFDLAEMEELFDIENFSLYFNIRKVLRISIRIKISFNSSVMQ